ncbi:MAG: AAA family ATPase [Chloroflexota bacterium]
MISEQRKNQQIVLSNHQKTESQLTGQIEGKQSRADGLTTERETLLQNQQTLQERNTQYTADLVVFTEQIQGTESRLNKLEDHRQQVEQNETNVRQHLQRLEGDYNRQSLEAARRQDELDNLQRQIQEDLGLVHLDMSDNQVGQPVLPIRPIVSDLPQVDELPAGVEEDVARLKVQTRRLENINPDAPKEYAEQKERYEYLTHQMDDLEAAAADLKEIIARLDEAMEEAFAETFERVAKEFQHYFKALFGGGESRLLLTNPESIIDTGVDIVARPPGKRLQSLALLSGGERSLTAQALIFALLRISPTPFVIFDEVDAMLDEANVDRFRDALANLGRDIQFIVITHNRKTIEAAQTLYGVSMGNDSVSQIYSIKVEEWLEKDY